MSRNKIIEGAKEALAVARGEQPAARITVQGHAYVPESELAALRERVNELEEPEVRCAGCGSAWSDADLAREKAKNPKLLSCCPERKPIGINEWRCIALATETRAETAERKLASLEAAHNTANGLLVSQAQQIQDCRTINDAAFRKLAEAREVINAIDQICHTPIGSNEKAHRHFLRDFDAIRKLALPFRAARAIMEE